MFIKKKKRQRGDGEGEGKEAGNEGERAGEIYVPAAEALRAGQLSAA